MFLATSAKCLSQLQSFPEEVSAKDETRRKKHTKSYNSKKNSFVRLTALASAKNRL